MYATASSFFSAPSNYKQLFAGAAQAQPDPDQEDVVWHEPEAYSAVISRKEHPCDVTSLLSIREVLCQKSPIDAAASVLPGGSRFGSLGSAATKVSSGSGAPPFAFSVGMGPGMHRCSSCLLITLSVDSGSLSHVALTHRVPVVHGASGVGYGVVLFVLGNQQNPPTLTPTPTHDQPPDCAHCAHRNGEHAYSARRALFFTLCIPS
ncbi:hypothetical protein FB451DRAFT_1465444 [Mycena latifolia]|nr:hypothetical protein FB451DRAFT_1465444 [Mycena latifolia]